MESWLWNTLTCIQSQWRKSNASQDRKIWDMTTSWRFNLWPLIIWKNVFCHRHTFLARTPRQISMSSIKFRFPHTAERRNLHIYFFRHIGYICIPCGYVLHARNTNINERRTADLTADWHSALKVRQHGPSHIPAN